VEYDERDRQIEADGRQYFRQRHAEAAVAGDGDRLALRLRELRRDGGGQGEAHRAPVPRNEDVLSARAPEVPVEPKHVLADVQGEHGFWCRVAAQAFANGRWVDGPAVRAPSGRLFGEARLPGGAQLHDPALPLGPRMDRRPGEELGNDFGDGPGEAVRRRS